MKQTRSFIVNVQDMATWSSLTLLFSKQTASTLGSQLFLRQPLEVGVVYHIGRSKDTRPKK
eukprot:scaffold88423_cov55-Attheya_sp.AAC.2